MKNENVGIRKLPSKFIKLFLYDSEIILPTSCRKTSKVNHNYIVCESLAVHEGALQAPFPALHHSVLPASLSQT